MIKLFNTLTGKKEDFRPLEENVVKMYHCGPTVYDYPHIGNLRSYVFADILRRTMELNGYEVTQVINITDVGHLTREDDYSGIDKVEEKARQEQKTAEEVASFYEERFLNDLAQLGIKTEGTLFPRASRHINEQIDLIEKLQKDGFVYKTSDGLYFDTSKLSSYGKLGQINKDALEAEARIDENPEKKHKADFALWKFSSPKENRQQEWDSPWGVGFPGWHIECSAMSMKYLGETFDIHTGGIDHIPIHHNNEIAQSESATGKPLANYWLHNEFVDLSGEKMAKSKGNTITLNDLKEKGIDPVVYRYWLLGAHYTTPVTFTYEAVQASGKALLRIKNYLGNIHSSQKPVSKEVIEMVKEKLNNDLDTPALISNLFEFSKDDNVSAEEKKNTLEYILSVLGIDLDKLSQPDELDLNDLPQELKKIALEREKARKDKDFGKADQLREELGKHGFEVIDSEDKSWFRKI